MNDRSKSILVLRKTAGRANSNDLEIPGGEKSRIYLLRLSFSKEKKFLNVTPSSKLDVGDVSVSKGSSTAAEQLKPRETNRRCDWKIQI